MTKKYYVKCQEPCSHCNGSGHVPLLAGHDFKGTCLTCNGAGVIEYDVPLKDVLEALDHPAGPDEKETISAPMAELVLRNRG